MSFSSELREAADALASRPELGAATPDLPRALRHIDGDDLVRLLRDAATLTRAVEKVRVIGAGILAERSARDMGQSGLAAKHGHRTPVEFVQSIGGVTRAEARRDVTLGASLLDGPGDEPGDGTGAGIDAPAPPDADRPQDWRAPLRAALLNGTLSTAQHEAIQRGLGDPPEDRDEGEAAEVWRIAAEQLTVEAAAMPVEELARRARQVRDVLDAAGAEKRFAQRFERRSYRSWTDQDGLHHGHIVYDDEMAAWVRSITAAGLRPRRGGPRFRTDEERAAEQSLIDDPRTNEQLEYDLLMQMLRAGALATAAEVFGARQPGVRMVTIVDSAGPRDAFGRALMTGHLEDGGDPLPGSVIARSLCETGAVPVTVDSCGNPLDVGREQRLFTAKQRIALAIRDGGCLWPGCVVPASYCEAHHCDHWSADHGSTDIDRGILLCRFHHLLLHNAGWHIRRGGHGPFLLHRPDGGPPIPVISRSPLRWAWDPPPDRGDWRQDHGGREDRPVGVPTPGRARGAPN